jgi:hypothetical protein
MLLKKNPHHLLKKSGGANSSLSLSVHNSQNSLKDTKLHFFKSPLEKKKEEDIKIIEAM